MRGRIITAFFAAGLLALAAGRPAPAQSPRLVAPLYPGAVPAGEPGVYLTRDGVSGVRAFYDARLGEGEVADGSFWAALGPGIVADEAGQLYWTVLSLGDARAITGESLGEAMRTTPAGVLVEGPDPEEHELVPGDVGSIPVVGGYFDRMEHLTRVGSLERSDIEPVLRRYLPLARMRYRIVEADDGRRRSFAEIHLRRCAEEGMGGRFVGDTETVSEEELEAMAERMQALYAEGKIEEALELQQRITELAMASLSQEALAEDEEGALETVDSGEALEILAGCLAELEAEAYPTRIRISTHPSEWKVDGGE